MDEPWFQSGDVTLIMATLMTLDAKVDYVIDLLEEGDGEDEED